MASRGVTNRLPHYGASTRSRADAGVNALVGVSELHMRDINKRVVVDKTAIVVA